MRLKNLIRVIISYCIERQDRLEINIYSYLGSIKDKERLKIYIDWISGLCDETRAGHVPTFLKSFRSVLERGASA